MAASLAGQEGRSILDNMLANAPPDRMRAFQAWTAARSRFVEDFVESAVAAGISQYVILGAGLDSFAYRHPGLLERLTIFEVDHPLSQAWKRRRLGSCTYRCITMWCSQPLTSRRSRWAMS